MKIEQLFECVKPGDVAYFTNGNEKGKEHKGKVLIVTEDKVYCSRFFGRTIVFNRRTKEEIGGNHLLVGLHIN